MRLHFKLSRLKNCTYSVFLRLVKIISNHTNTYISTSGSDSTRSVDLGLESVIFRLSFVAQYPSDQVGCIDIRTNQAAQVAG